MLLSRNTITVDANAIFLDRVYLLSLIFQLRDYVYMYRWLLPHRDENFGTRDRLLRIYATAISLERCIIKITPRSWPA